MRLNRMSDSTGINLHFAVGRAGLWVGIRMITVRGIAILQLLLLAQLLAPADFGMFAVATMVYAFIEAMTFLGLGHALIQRKTLDFIDLDTLFVVNVVRGILLAILVIVLSSPVARLMGVPDSQPIIATIGLLPLVLGFHNPAMILFQKELQMRQELSFYLAGAVVNLGVSLIFAVEGWGAWALILGMLGQSIAQLTVSYIIQPFRPKIRFSKSSFDQMFKFGKWLLASQGLKYFSNNLPSWVIGHYLGIHVLGFYHIAGRFSQAIGNEFAALISTVAFPLYSKIQSDQKRLAMAYLRSQKIILSASFLLYACMIALARPFVDTFLGGKWLGVENLIILLSLVGVVQSVGAQAEIMKAIDSPRIIAKLSLFRLLLSASLIVFLTNTWGVEGAVISVLLPTTILLPVAMAIILRRLSISIYTFLKVMLSPLLSLILVSVISLLVGQGTLVGYSGFLAAALGYIFVYCTLLWMIDKALETGIAHEWRILVSGLLRRSPMTTQEL